MIDQHEPDTGSHAIVKLRRRYPVTAIYLSLIGALVAAVWIVEVLR